MREWSNYIVAASFSLRWHDLLCVAASFFIFEPVCFWLKWWCIMWQGIFKVSEQVFNVLLAIILTNNSPFLDVALLSVRPTTLTGFNLPASTCTKDYYYYWCEDPETGCFNRTDVFFCWTPTLEHELLWMDSRWKQRHHQNGFIYYGSQSRAVSTKSLSRYRLGPSSVETRGLECKSGLMAWNFSMLQSKMQLRC